MVTRNSRNVTIGLILLTLTLGSGCSSTQIYNDPNTIVDDLLVLGTMGMYRGY